MAHFDKRLKRWRCRWRDRNGVRKSKLLPKGSSRIQADEVEAKLKLGLLGYGRSSPSFAEWSEVWFKEYAQIHKTTSSQKKDRGILDHHLIPRFGRLRMDEIVTRDLIALQNDLMTRYAPQSTNNILSLMSSICKYAVAHGKAMQNPCFGLKRIRSPRTHHPFWTPDEASRFLICAREQNYEVFRLAAFALNTGLRPGEMQGLLRDSLDFELGYVHVTRNWCTKTNQLLNYTKTKSSRKVPVARPILDFFADKRSAEPLDQIFSEIKFSTFGMRFLKPIAEQAKVKVIRFHDLRHTFASHLIMRGKHPVEVMELLGHTKLETTMRYMHLAEDRNKGATDILLEGATWLRPSAEVVSIRTSRM